MGDVTFNDPNPLRTVHLTGHRTHVLFTNFVRENEKKGIAQPEASWLAVDQAMDEVEKWQKKKNAACRKRKWGDAAIDVQKTKNKKRKYFTKKDAERLAKRRFENVRVYNFLRSIAARTGQTIEEAAADGPTAAVRKKYFAAIAECRDKKSIKEAAARRELAKKEQADRETRAAKVRKRPDLVRRGRISNKKTIASLVPFAH